MSNIQPLFFLLVSRMLNNIVPWNILSVSATKVKLFHNDQIYFAKKISFHLDTKLPFLKLAKEKRSLLYFLSL